MADVEKRYLINFQDNLDQYAQHAADARDKVDKLTVENLRLKASGSATTVEIEKSNAALKAAQQDYRNAQKSVELATKANQAHKNSYDELYKRWQLAQTQLKLMGDGYTVNEKGVRVLSQAYIEQSKIVADAKAGLDSFGKGIHDNRLNVGNYTESIQAAIGNFQMMPGPVGQAASSIQMFGKSLLTLLANPIVLAIAAITAAFVGLFKAFKSTDTGGTELVARFEQLKAILDVVRQRTVSLISAFGELFKGNFRKAGEEFKDTFTGIGEQIREATAAAYDYQKALDAIEDSQANYISREAEIRNQIAKLEYTAQDRSKSTAERKKALDEAIKLGEQNSKQLADFARQNYEAAAAELAGKSQLRQEDILSFIRMTDAEQAAASETLRAARNNYEDQFEALEKMYADMIDADTRFYEENKRNISRQTGFMETLRKEQEEAKVKQLEREADIARAAMDAELQAFLEMEVAKRDIHAEVTGGMELIDKEYERRRRESAALNYENERAIMEQDFLARYALYEADLQRQKEAEIANAEAIGASVRLINEKYAQAEQEIERAKQAAKLSLAAGFAGDLAEIFGKNTAVGKAAAVAQTTIETYASATKAFSSLASIPVVGTVLGAAAAAAAIASGIANVKKILSVKSGLPGDSGGGSGAGGSAPAPRLTATPVNAAAMAIAGSQAAQSLRSQPSGASSLMTATGAQTVQIQGQGEPLTADAIASAVSKLPSPVVTVEDINAKTAEKIKVENKATI